MHKEVKRFKKKDVLFCTITRGTKLPFRSLSTYAFITLAAHLTQMPT